MSATVRMGLHLDDSTIGSSFSDDELYARRRVFAVIYMMDTYLSYMLGIPRTLRSTHVQPPLGLPPHSMIDEGEQFLELNASSPIAETVMAQKLHRTFAKIIDRQSEDSVESWVDKDWITEIENELKSWEASLPVLPNEGSNSRVLLGQLQLRLYNAGAQILLYSPCIHHLGRHKSDPNFNLDGFTYGSACVSAGKCPNHARAHDLRRNNKRSYADIGSATQAVLLVELLYSQKLLMEAAWVPKYLLTWAAVVLTYFVMHSKTRVTIQDSISAAKKAQNMLDVLGKDNVADKRIHDCLEPYIEIAAGYNA